MSQKSTILIVDDEPIGRQLIDAILYKEGYNLEFAENGREAFEKAKAVNPDLILLDVMMPEVDGFEVCQMLRADSKMTNVPIILVTALDDIDSRIRGLEAGADDYISKPFDRLELLARIKIITRLNKYRKNENGPEKGTDHAVKNGFSTEMFHSLSSALNKKNVAVNTVFSGGFAENIQGTGKGGVLFNISRTNNKKHFFFNSGNSDIGTSLLGLYFSSVIPVSILSNSSVSEDLQEVIGDLKPDLFTDEKITPGCGIISYDTTNATVEYTGINNSIFLLNSTGVKKYTGDEIDLKKGQNKISSKNIVVKEGDKIFICSYNNNDVNDGIENILASPRSNDLNDLKSEIINFLKEKTEAEKECGEILIACLVV